MREKIDLKNIELDDDYLNDKNYLKLLADMGILDDMEDWELYQEMDAQMFANLDDETIEKYWKPGK